jgi:hypothetical protein
MKQVLDKSQAIYYVDESDMVKFISINMPMARNKSYAFVREFITSEDAETVFYDKKDITDNPNSYLPDQVQWIGAFFDTHPWIDRMMVVFDD